MIEREVLKDINEYSPKFIGPFSAREFACSAIGCIMAGIAFSFFYFVCNLITPICLFLAALFFVPAGLCGWLKPYGIPLEKLAYKYIKTAIFCPKNRKYIVKNAYAEFAYVPPKHSNKELKVLRKQRLLDEKELGEEGKAIK